MYEQVIHFSAISEPLRSKIKALFSTFISNQADYHTFVSVVAMAAQKKLIDISFSSGNTNICFGQERRCSQPPRNCFYDKRAPFCSRNEPMYKAAPIMRFTRSSKTRLKSNSSKNISGETKRATTGFSLHGSLHSTNEKKW